MDVGRFDIAMNDACLMRGIQGFCDLDGDVDLLFVLQRLLLRKGIKRLPGRYSIAMKGCSPSVSPTS